MDRKRQKLSPGKNDVQKECQDAKITALERKFEHMENKLKLNDVQRECQDEKIASIERKFEHMENKLKLVIAELEQVKEERARDKINFETEKCELESKIDKYKEQCAELQSENEKLQREYESQITKVNESNDDALDINSLPNEIILNVFRYLEQNQLGQIARVCRRWNVLTKSPVLWRKVNVEIFSSDRSWTTVAKSFINGLPSCVTFIRLDFAEWVFRESEDLISIVFEELCAELYQNCPHLEELFLEHCAISNILPEDINFCTRFLQCVKKLVFHEVVFCDNNRTVELDDNSKIEVLDAYCCDFSYFCNIQISKLLCLKELRLALTNVDDTWFVDDASFFNMLYVLDLGWTKITASTFLAIQRHGHNLKELYLCCVNLKDLDLCFSNSTFPYLKTICIYDTYVTCEGVVSLLQSCPSLETVYVDEDVAESFAAHPFVVANRCKSGIVKTTVSDHDHKVDYSHN